MTTKDIALEMAVFCRQLNSLVAAKITAMKTIKHHLQEQQEEYIQRQQDQHNPYDQQAAATGRNEARARQIAVFSAKANIVFLGIIQEMLTKIENQPPDANETK